MGKSPMAINVLFFCWGLACEIIFHPPNDPVGGPLGAAPALAAKRAASGAPTLGDIIFLVMPSLMIHAPSSKSILAK